MNIFTKFKKLSMVKISKTYVPKETEKYMCAKHLAYFKLKLNEWKKDLKRSNNEAIAQASMDDNSASADIVCLLYTSPSPRDYGTSRMPSSA